MENRLLAIDGIRKARAGVGARWKASVEGGLRRKFATKAGRTPTKNETRGGTRTVSF